MANAKKRKRYHCQELKRAEALTKNNNEAANTL